MNRYAIVRVDNNCPSWCGDNPKLDYIVCDLKDKNCKNCRYGDTKEQLVHKIAQVIMRRKLKVKIAVYKKLTLLYGEGFINKKELKELYLMCLSLAKEIVEFLGVEE